MKKILSLLFTFFLISALQGQNVNWSFPPTPLSSTVAPASNPLVGIDKDGNSVAVWVENNRVRSSNKHTNSGWTAAVNVSSKNASSPCLTVDANGNATAIWIEAGVAKGATKTLNGSWSSSVALSQSGASSPSLCVDCTGNVVAAWIRGNNVESSTKLFMGTWQAKITINSSDAANPVVAIGGSGSNTRAYIVWQGTSGGNSAIFSSTRTIFGGTWSSGQVISNSNHEAANPYVVVDSNANAIAVWYAYGQYGNNFTNVILQSAMCPSGGNWGELSDLSEPGIGNPQNFVAKVAIDATGNAIALWNTSFDDQTYHIQSAVKPVNGIWSEAVDLVDSNLYAYTVDLSTTAFGDVLGLYMFYNGASLLIQSTESDINGFLNNFWSVPVTISYQSNNAFPKIAASINGNTIYAAAVWLHYDGSVNNVVAATGSKSLVSPPSNLHVSQNTNPFGVFSEYYNTLTWNASLDPNVVGYLIFRNGLFLEQVDPGVLQYIDDNRTLNGSVTYSVTAINAQKEQSPTASIHFP